MRTLVILVSSFLVAAALPVPSSSAYQQSKVYSCPMHPEVQSSKPRRCPKCGMKLEAQKQPANPNLKPATGSKSTAFSQRTIEIVKAEEYTCSMHPDTRTSAPGKCPKCGMTLVPVNPAILDEFNLRVECSPRAPRPGEKIRLHFSFFNPKTGEQVKEFYITHDKLFHLFVVSEDLSEFQHIHPTFEPDGSFIMETVLPVAGNYKLYADVYPHDGAPQVLQQNLATVGYSNDLVDALPHLKPDTSLIRIADGMKIELKLEPSEIIAGQPLALKYHLTNAKTGEPIRDLVPYLGAWGHTLILSEDQADYVHSHPEETVPETADKQKLRGGPDATFNAFLPRPSIYRIWTQFQRGETLTTVSFTVRADRLH